MQIIHENHEYVILFAGTCTLILLFFCSCFINLHTIHYNFVFFLCQVNHKTPGFFSPLFHLPFFFCSSHMLNVQQMVVFLLFVYTRLFFVEARFFLLSHLLSTLKAHNLSFMSLVYID